MPDPRAFLKAFGLVKGQRIGDLFTISSMKSSHVIVQQYREYQYGIELVLTYDGKGGKENDFVARALVELQKHFAGLKKPMIVLSGYGNPYDCIVDAPSRTRMHENKDTPGSVIVHLTGHAVRIFTNVVTPQKSAGRQKKGVAADSTDSEGKGRKKEAEPAVNKRTIAAVSSVASNTRSKSRIS